MLDDALKKNIQTAYSKFLSAKSLKPRYGQKMMVAEIARTLGNIELDDEENNISTDNIVAVEAGTGTGKTVAYLMATIPIAKALDKKVVLSTATIALQEQVVDKDLPDVLKHSGLGFSFALAKGRGRYVCLSKLEKIVGDALGDNIAAMYEDEVIVVSEPEKLLYREMLQKTASGDWNGDKDSWEKEFDTTTWQRVTTDHRQCTGRKCPNIRECAFYNARNELDETDVIVANHDLVLADLALGGGAILPAPENAVYIFDEGHHLPEKALNHFAANLRYRGTIRWLGQSEGQWQNTIKSLSDLTHFNQLAERMEPCLKQARSVLEEGLPLVREKCDAIELDQHSPRLYFDKGEVGPELEGLAKEASKAFLSLNEVVEKLYREVETLINEDSQVAPRSDLENILGVLGAWLTRTEGNLALWQSYRETQFQEQSPYARWITLNNYNDTMDYELVSSPVLASGILAKGLWSRCCGSVITSATLRALNSFERFQIRAGLPKNTVCAAVPSPFDFNANATLTIPERCIDANKSIEHTENIIELLPKIIDKKEGTLVLFSSHYQMNQVYDAMPDDLQRLILCQGYESKQRMIQSHKRRMDRFEGSVLWGLSSFAEGVDLPGDYCKHVIISKIPFAVPDEPLEKAFSEWIEAKGGNAFMQVTVPDASTRLIQACGRLLRTETDTGRISILDRRLISKRYGSALLNSLPPFRRI